MTRCLNIISLENLKVQKENTNEEINSKRLMYISFDVT